MAQRTACPQTPNYTIYKIRFHKGARPKQRRQEFKSQGEKESVFVVLGAGNTFLNGAENSGGEMEPGGGGCVDCISVFSVVISPFSFLILVT